MTQHGLKLVKLGPTGSKQVENFPKHPKMSQNIPKYHNTSQNIPKLKLFQNVPKQLKTPPKHQNLTKHSKMS